MAPDSAYQLYTLHGFCQGESLPPAWALLPNKTEATYTEMFTAIRCMLINTYGNIGTVRYFLTDFELAAINSIRTVFPETTIKGCTFHFRQALVRRLAAEGLQSAYNDFNPPEVRAWIRKLMAMALLPAFLVPYAWQFLKFPPVVSDELLHQKLIMFGSYFEKMWISGQFPPDLWTHFDHTGPRTTNHAEGWHNSLKKHFGVPHPSACTILNWLQKYQYEKQRHVVSSWQQVDAQNVEHWSTSNWTGESSERKSSWIWLSGEFLLRFFRVRLHGLSYSLWLTFTCDAQLTCLELNKAFSFSGHCIIRQNYEPFWRVCVEVKHA